MGAEALPLIAYVFATTFTPGPNNISSASAGASIGLRKAIPYLLGISAGFLAVMLASGFFTYYLKAAYAPLALFMKWLGFAYMLWLCASLFRKPKTGGSGTRGFNLASGFLLQFVNPKVILYGVSLFGAFSDVLLAGSIRVFLASAAFSALAFASVLAWCAAGSALTRLLSDKRRLLAFNLVLAALLLYSAFAMLLE